MAQTFVCPTLRSPAHLVGLEEQPHSPLGQLRLHGVAEELHVPHVLGALHAAQCIADRPQSPLDSETSESSALRPATPIPAALSRPRYAQGTVCGR